MKQIKQTQYIVEEHEKLKNIFIVSYGNLSIVRLFIYSCNRYELENILLKAIYENHIKIVKYLFENFFKKNEFQIRNEIIGNILLYSLCDKTKYLFKYIMEQINYTNSDALKEFSWPIPILTNACSSQNISAVKYITDLILKENPNEDFSEPFNIAASIGSIEICNFFMTKK